MVINWLGGLLSIRTVLGSVGPVAHCTQHIEIRKIVQTVAQIGAMAVGFPGSVTLVRLKTSTNTSDRLEIVKPGQAMPRSSQPSRFDKRVIAKRLADDLDVSISTISRAFNPHARISPKTRARVLEHARSVGYQPNPYAQSLTTRQNTIVGIIVSDIVNPFYPEVLARLCEALRQAGLNVMLFQVPDDQTPDEVLPQALVYQPEFVIVMSATISFQATVMAADNGTNLIFVNRYVPDSPTFSVTCDNVQGGRAIADHFVETDHRHLAYIAGPPDATTTRDRWKGFSERCGALGIGEVRNESAGVFSYEAGYRAALRLLDITPHPDAIFCANDVLALGALEAIRSELGLAVPDDVSLAGFDDISMSSWPSHSLTTYRQPVRRMIAKTIELIKKIGDDPEYEPVSIRIEGRLIIRDSTRNHRR
jgi:DNA-binding LacI/PurR family transcriptional regulator